LKLLVNYHCMNIKNKIVGIIAVVALILSGFAVSAPSTIEKVITGAATGPDMPFQYLRFGLGKGIKTTQFESALTTATTTVCAIQSPAATSTLVRGGILVTTSSTTASTLTIAKSATAFSTTTVLGQGALAANAQGFLAASTTAIVAGGTGSNLNPNFVFGPNQWFVASFTGGTGTFSPVGTCHASFEEYEVY